MWFQTLSKKSVPEKFWLCNIWRVVPNMCECWELDKWQLSFCLFRLLSKDQAQRSQRRGNAKQIAASLACLNMLRFILYNWVYCRWYFQQRSLGIKSWKPKGHCLRLDFPNLWITKLALTLYAKSVLLTMQRYPILRDWRLTRPTKSSELLVSQVAGLMENELFFCVRLWH